MQNNEIALNSADILKIEALYQGWGQLVIDVQENGAIALFVVSPLGEPVDALILGYLATRKPFQITMRLH